MLKKIFLLCFSSLLFWSCSYYSELGKLAVMDIGDATTLLVAPGDSLARSSEELTDDNVLFKITEEGDLEFVALYDESGNEIITEAPVQNVFNINDEFIAVEFSSFFVNFRKVYLVRKTDGAVFLLADLENPMFLPAQEEMFYSSNPVFKSDDAGNIYYLGNGQEEIPSGIVKVEASISNSLSASFISPVLDFVSYFVISSDGHAAYETLEGKRRILKSNGSLYNIPDGFDFWSGLDGNIKFKDGTSQYSVSINSSSFEVSYEQVTDYSYYLMTDGYVFDFGDKILVIQGDREMSLLGDIYEIVDSATQPSLITFNQIDDITHAAASDNYYYLAGADSSNNPLLLKVDPDMETGEVILSNGLYEIYELSADSNDTVYFSALRMSDGAKVLGTVDASGTVEILDEDTEREITTIVRIN